MPAPATPNVPYASGDFTVATPCSWPVFAAPFKEDGINVDYILTQDFMIKGANFARLALDTPHPDYPDFLLVEESEQRDVTGGRVRWTRTYAKLPDDYEKPKGNFQFTFPGFSGLVYGGIVGFGGSDEGRLPPAKTVPVIIARAFYLTNDPETDIPMFEKFVVTYGGNDLPVDYVNDNASNPNFADTTPSRTEYDALKAAGDRLIAQDSTWDVWMGNIYVRETFYVKAQ
jgi:hypothetical protein